MDPFWFVCLLAVTCLCILLVQVILVSLLKEPINRGVYDFVIKSPRIVDLFDRYAVLGQLLLLGVGS